MKEAISRHTIYRLEQGEFDEEKIREYLQDLQRRGYSTTFIQAIFEQASVELESESQNTESIDEMNYV